MSDSGPNTSAGQSTVHDDAAMESPQGKGKSAAVPHPDPIDSSDEEGEEEAGDVEEPDEDNMEEIDTDNIISDRTRQRKIDYAQAAKDMPEDEDDDEEDDSDFEDGIADEDRMEE